MEQKISYRYLLFDSISDSFIIKYNQLPLKWYAFYRPLTWYYVWFCHFKISYALIKKKSLKNRGRLRVNLGGNGHICIMFKATLTNE